MKMRRLTLKVKFDRISVDLHNVVHIVTGTTGCVFVLGGPVWAPVNGSIWNDITTLDPKPSLEKVRYVHEISHDSGKSIRQNPDGTRSEYTYDRYLIETQLGYVFGSGIFELGTLLHLKHVPSILIKLKIQCGRLWWCLSSKWS